MHTTVLRRGEGEGRRYFLSSSFSFFCFLLGFFRSRLSIFLSPVSLRTSPLPPPHPPPLCLPLSYFSLPPPPLRSLSLSLSLILSFFLFLVFIFVVPFFSFILSAFPFCTFVYFYFLFCFTRQSLGSQQIRQVVERSTDCDRYESINCFSLSATDATKMQEDGIPSRWRLC